MIGELSQQILRKLHVIARFYRASFCTLLLDAVTGHYSTFKNRLGTHYTLNGGVCPQRSFLEIWHLLLTNQKKNIISTLCCDVQSKFAILTPNSKLVVLHPGYIGGGFRTKWDTGKVSGIRTKRRPGPGGIPARSIHKSRDGTPVPGPVQSGLSPAIHR